MKQLSLPLESTPVVATPIFPIGVLTKEMATVMFKTQDSLNTLIDPDWRTRANNWDLACAMETGECIGHIGYEWWKHTEPNIPMAQNELVDVWHFVVSKALEYGVPLDVFLESFESDSPEVEEEAERVRKLTLLMILQDLMLGFSSGATYVTTFTVAMEKLELSWHELFLQYIGKNTLNIFRQKNGYKEGTYKKSWVGKEDNEIMLANLEYLKDNEVPSKDIAEALYQCLAEDYESLFGEAN